MFLQFGKTIFYSALIDPNF